MPPRARVLASRASGMCQPSLAPAFGMCQRLFKTLKELAPLAREIFVSLLDRQRLQRQPEQRRGVSHVSLRLEKAWV